MAEAGTSTKDDDVEILVHISAPAMSKDDAIYRALAKAYLNFNPVSRTSLAHPQSSHRVASSTPKPQSHVTQTHELFGPSFESAQLSFEGAWDNANSPKLTVLPKGQSYQPSSFTSAQPTSSPPGEDEEEMGAEEFWIAPPSTVQDSMPWNDLRLPELSSPSRTLEHFLGLDEDSSLDCSVLGTSLIRDGAKSSNSHISGNILTPAMSSPVLPPTSQRGPTGGPREVEAGVVIPATSSDLPSKVASKYSSRIKQKSKIVATTLGSPMQQLLPSSEAGTEDDGANGSVVEDTILEDTTIEDTPLRPLKRDSAHHSRAGSDPLPSKRVKPSTPRPLTGSSSDTGPESPGSRIPVYPLTLRNPSNSDFLSMLEIEAPSPKTSAARLAPDDLITPNMHLLMRSFGLPRRLDSVTCYRHLRPFERGYWLIDCAGWDPGLVHRAWGFLYNYVTDGFAGWGSRCVREEGWQWIRFWSFGYVAKHIYLLLHVATERAVKSVEISWIDGAGEVVLVTQGHT